MERREGEEGEGPPGTTRIMAGMETLEAETERKARGRPKKVKASETEAGGIRKFLTGKNDERPFASAPKLPRSPVQKTNEASNDICGTTQELRSQAETEAPVDSAARGEGEQLAPERTDPSDMTRLENAKVQSSPSQGKQIDK